MAKLLKEVGLGFDDVSLVPQFGVVDSRKNIDLCTRISSVRNTPLFTRTDLNLSIPLIAANMSSICEEKMAMEMARLGGAGFLHRYKKPEQIIDIIRLMKNNNYHPIVPSIGVGEKWIPIVDQYFNEGADAICIDIAHGHCGQMIDLLRQLRHNYPNKHFIAGNIATADAAVDLMSAGATGLKVGIAQGCLAANTRILMANGFYKDIISVQPGDRIINMNGKPRTVKDQFCTGIKETISIKNTQSINKTYITTDHKCYVGDLNSSSPESLSSKGYAKLLNTQSKTTPKATKFKWKPVGEMRQDVFLLPNKIEFEIPNDFTINLEDFSIKKEFLVRYKTVAKPSYNLGYIFGTFLGDGSARVMEYKKSKRGAVTWAFGLNELDIAQKLSKALSEVFGVSGTIQARKNTIIVSLYSKQIAHLLIEFDKHENKSLPEKYWCNDKNYHMGLWDGLMDSDGCFSGGHESFCNTSQQLCELYFILTYLIYGGFPNVDFREPSVGGLKDCNLDNCKPSYILSLNKTFLKRQINQFAVVKNLHRDDVLISQKVYDLEIDDDTHSFIADNMIVHNSVCTTRTQTGAGVPQITALLNVASRARPYHIPVISDGGARSSGDICKALAAGASAVMSGCLFAGSDECPEEATELYPTALVAEEYKDGSAKIFAMKKYFGMASAEAKQSFFGSAEHVEGAMVEVRSKGPVEKIVARLLDGIRSGISYCGANSAEEIYNTSEFIEIKR